MKTLTADKSAVDRKIGTTGVYTSVQRVNLKTITGGYQLKNMGRPLRLYNSRARLYEALPPESLGLNTRRSGIVMRDGSGG